VDVSRARKSPAETRPRVPTRRPSDPSERSGGEVRPLVSFEWPDVDCRRRRPHPASQPRHVAERKAKNRRQKVAPWPGRAREITSDLSREKTTRQRGGCGEGERNSDVAPLSSVGAEKKSIPAPGGGARYAPSVRGGCRLPFARARGGCK